MNKTNNVPASTPHSLVSVSLKLNDIQKSIQENYSTYMKFKNKQSYSEYSKNKKIIYST